MSPSSKMPAGQSYLFNLDSTHSAYVALKHLLFSGHRGYVLSKNHPDKITERYEIDCPIIWIVGKPPPGGKAITVDPIRLGRIYSLISDYVKNNPGSAVLLDGIEYLISQNDFPSVMKTLQLINESIVLTLSIFLLPVDQNVMSPQEYSFLEREIPPLDMDVDLL